MSYADAHGSVDVAMMRRERHRWRTSLSGTGTVAHDGSIRPSQIRRVAIVLPELHTCLHELTTENVYIPMVGVYGEIAQMARRHTRRIMGAGEPRGRLGVTVPPSSRRIMTVRRGKVVDERVV